MSRHKLFFLGLLMTIVFSALHSFSYVNDMALFFLLLISSFVMAAETYLPVFNRETP